MNKSQSLRKNKILSYLAKDSLVSVQELVDNLDYSISTIKRDLVDLEKDGLIRRTRGGAMLVDITKVDTNYLLKLADHTQEQNKRRVASLAIKKVKNDMTLFLDSSSTVLHLIPYLSKFHGLHIVTNSSLTATLLAEYTTAEVIILGGIVGSKKFTINSAQALLQLRLYQFDAAFISCKGFSMNKGLTESTEGEALLKHELKNIAKDIYVLATPNKRECIYFYKSLDITSISELFV